MTSILERDPLRVAGYVRANGIEEVTPEAQRKGIEDLADREGWQLVEVYVDQSGPADIDFEVERPAFSTMLDDASRGRFDVLVTHSLDRLSRDLGTAMNAFRILADHNVRYRAVAEDIDYSTPEGYLQMVILGAFCRYFEN